MMNNMKEFLKESKNKWEGKVDYEPECPYCYHDTEWLDIKALGLFFWKRGGKEYVKQWKFFIDRNNYKGNKMLKTYIGLATDDEGNTKKEIRNGQRFLDCVACLGESKVKELIKNG